MSDDGWRRPDSGAAPVELPVFEIPLDDVADERPAHDGDEPATEWRKVIGLSALGGVVLGIVVAIVLTSGGDGDDAAPATTADLASIITSPPTLPPLEDDGPGADEPISDDELRGRLDATDVAATVSTLPGSETTDGEVDPPVDPPVDLAAIVAEDGVARRAVTEYVVGADAYHQTITITNDPANDRYTIEFEIGDGNETAAVFDLAAGDAYFPDDTTDGRWNRVAADGIVDVFGGGTAESLLRALQLGPLRDDTLAGVRAVRENGPVEVADLGVTLDEIVVVVEAGAVPRWARYALGPTSEAPPPADSELVGFAVYVDDDGAIRRVVGESTFGSTTERWVHTVEVLDDAPTIDLPDLGAPPTADPMATPYPELPAPADSTGTTSAGRSTTSRSTHRWSPA